MQSAHLVSECSIAANGKRPAVEFGSPMDDPRAFRRCLGQFGTGVAVITTRLGETVAGLTSNSFASVSLDPPLVLWSIKRTSQSFPIFLQAPHFAVNVLAAGQIGLSRRFASSGTDKFDGIEWRGGEGGVPLLDGIIASLECRRTMLVEGGDHVVLLGTVERYCRYEGEGLLFVQGRYAVATDDAGDVKETPDAAHAGREPDDLLASMLVRGYAAMNAAIGDAREAEGLSLIEGRMLRAIQTSPGSRLASLLPEILVGANAGEHTVSELAARDLVTVDRQGRLSLTVRGENCLAAVLGHARAYQDKVLEGLPAADIHATERVLLHLSKAHPGRRPGKPAG